MKKADVIVIGGGVTGLYLSSKLADNGLKVIVLEKKAAVDENIVCAGVISTKLFEEFDIDKTSILKTLRQIKIISPYDNKIDYEHTYDFAYIVDRNCFNRNLANRATEQGVEIIFQSEVNRIAVNKHNVDVYTKDKYTSSLVVISTGVSYNLNKQINIGIPKNFLRGINIEINGNGIKEPTLYIGNNIAPGAFGWALPISENRLRIGLITEKNPKRYLDNLINKIFESNKNINIANINTGYKLIAQSTIKPSATERVVAVGEAAGQVKATTGGGIYFGILCADIAAEIIKKSFQQNNFSYNLLSEYEIKWNNILNHEIINGYRIRKICSKLSDSSIENILNIIKYNGIIRMVQSIGDFDWHVSLLEKIISGLSNLLNNKNKESKVNLQIKENDISD